MSLYIHVVIEIRPGQYKQCLSVMSRAVALHEELGWKLAGSYAMRSGRWNTLLHLWEFSDMASYEAAIKRLVSHPGFAAIKKDIDETVLCETVTFATKFDYAGRTKGKS